ncbi:unnamed protein product [marine sediment metagenome]|uniref:Uncharacterized protein n=1 Tax=marine sediment metagenome TaxID=412755 RepID=X1K719_9ZZZZ
MGVKLPDPKELVDSVADGGVEVIKGPARIADNVAAVANTYAKEMHTNLDEVQKRMPDDPSVIPDFAIKTVGQTVKAGIGLFEGITKGAMDTFDGVKTQIKRVTG